MSSIRPETPATSTTAAEVTSSRLRLKHPPRRTDQTKPVARSAAPRHLGFKAQMFDADKQNPNLSKRDQGSRNAEGPDT